MPQVILYNQNEIADMLTGYITNHEDRPVHLDVKTWSKALTANVEVNSHTLTRMY